MSACLVEGILLAIEQPRYLELLRIHLEMIALRTGDTIVRMLIFGKDRLEDVPQVKAEPLFDEIEK